MNIDPVKITENSPNPPIPKAPEKPKSAIEQLEKIEAIINEKLRQPAALSVKKLRELNEVSKGIHKEYIDKVSKLNWFVRFFFSDERKINKTRARIENLIKSIEEFPSNIPEDAMSIVAQNLGPSDLASLAKVSRHMKESTKASADAAIIKHAQEVGYLGTDRAKASEYLNELYDEIVKACDEKIIPTEYIAYKKTIRIGFFGLSVTRTSFDKEKTLQNLKKCTIEDFNRMFFSFLKNLQTSRWTHHDHHIISANAEADNAKKSRLYRLFLLLILKNVLKNGMDPNTLIDRVPILHWAADNGDVDFVDTLIKKGARINEENIFLKSALTLVYSRVTLSDKHIAIIKLLIEHGANPNKHTGYAIGDKYIDTGSEYKFNHNYHFYGPILHTAIHRGHLEIVKALIKKGANVNAVSMFTKRTAFDEVCVCSDGEPQPYHIAIIRLLLQHGAIVDPNTRLKGTPLLQWAAYYGELYVVSELIRQGAYIDALSSTGTALGWICSLETISDQHIAIVNWLLDRGADPNARMHGKPILHWAASQGHLRIVEALLKKGARIDEVDIDNRTALGQSVIHNNKDVILLLLQRGANPNLPQGDTSALRLAQQYGNKDIVELLQNAEHLQKSHSENASGN